MVIAIIGVLMTTACTNGGSSNSSLEGLSDRDLLNQVARDATTRLYAALDRLPDDLAPDEAQQFWQGCGTTGDELYFRVEAGFPPSDGLGPAFEERLVPWAQEQGWSIRDRSSGDDYFYGLDDPELGWILGATARSSGGGRYELGVSTACYPAYQGSLVERGRLPDDLTEFVRERRPVDELPVLDPDRGPIEVNTTGEVQIPMDLTESE